MTAAILTHPKLEEQQRAWNEYVSLHKRAQETLDFADGRAAGLAWRRFLNVFISEAQRP